MSELPSRLDGIVIRYGSLPGGPIDNFDPGKTATHERTATPGRKTRLQDSWTAFRT